MLNSTPLDTTSIGLEADVYEDRIEYHYEAGSNALFGNPGVIEAALASKVVQVPAVGVTPSEPGNPNEPPPAPPESVNVPDIGPNASAVYALLAKRVSLRVERGGGFELEYVGLRNDLVADDGSHPPEAELVVRASGLAGLDCIQESAEGGLANNLYHPEDVLAVPECAAILAPLLPH